MASSLHGAYRRTAPRGVQRSACAAVASVILLCGALSCVGATPALAEAPWWQLSSETVPTPLPSAGEGQIVVVASNLGDAPIDATKQPAVFRIELPQPLTATAIQGPLKNQTQVTCKLTTLDCTFTGVLNPYEQLSIVITTNVTATEGAVPSLVVQAYAEGGGAAPVAKALQVPIGTETPLFGVAGFEMAPYNQDGSSDRQAGAHPFELTTTLALNQTRERYPVELPKDLAFQLPAGLVGNPNATARCTMANFFALERETNLCPPTSVVGVATVVAHEPLASVLTRTVPVFNLVAAQGEPARFGFEVLGKIPIVIDTSVRSGRDYGVDVAVRDATETAGLLSSQVTFREYRAIRGMATRAAGNASPAARTSFK